MFCDGIARRAARLSATMILSTLIACAGIKISTPGVEAGGTKVGSGSVEVPPENKLATENKQATDNKQTPQNKQALETKQNEEPE